MNKTNIPYPNENLDFQLFSPIFKLRIMKNNINIINFIGQHVGCLFRDKEKIYNDIIKLLRLKDIHNSIIIFIQPRSNKKIISAVLKKNKLDPSALQKNKTINFINIPFTAEHEKEHKRNIEKFMKSIPSKSRKDLILIIDQDDIVSKGQISNLLNAEKINIKLMDNYKLTLLCLFDLRLLNPEYSINIFISHSYILYNNKLLKNIYYNNNFDPGKIDLSRNIDYFISSLTEHKNLQENFTTNESKLLSIINLLPNIFIRIDFQGDIKYTNIHFEDISGYDFNSLAEKNFFSIFIKKNIRQQLRKEMLKMDLVNYEVTLISKKGEVKNILLNSKKTENEILLIGTNITRRRLIEEKLFDLSKRFQRLFEILPIGLALVNENGAIFQINEKLKEFTSYNEFDLIGEKCYNSLCLKKTCLLEKTKLSKRQDDIITLKQKNKELHLIRTCQKIILNKKTWLLISLMDISNIKKAEEEQKHSLMIEHVLNKITLDLVKSENLQSDIEASFGKFGKELNLSRINLFTLFIEDEEQYLKQTHEWLKSKNIAIKEKVQKLNINSFPFFKEKLINKGQKIVLNSISELPDNAVNERLLMEKLGLKSVIICPLTYKKNTYGTIGFHVTEKERLWKSTDINFIVLFTDILISVISKQQIEQKLLKTENSFRSILERSDGTAFFILSDDGKIIKWNRGAEKFYGYQEKDILYKKFDLIIKDTKKAQEKLIKAGTDGQYKTSKPEQRLKKSGEIIFIEETIICIKEEDEIVGYTVINRDVTKTELFLKELIELEKLDSIGKLARAQVHDLNNMFTTMNGYLELIFQDINPNHSFYEHFEKLSKTLETAIDTNNRIIELDTEQEHKWAPINLNNIIHNLSRLIKTLLGENIRLVLDLDEKLDPFEANTSQIEQIIINLASNCKEAVTEEGLMVIETQNISLEKEFISSFDPIPPGEYILLRISDNGKGIQQDIKHRILDPFFTTKEHNKGLGLTIAEKIIKNHSGYIHIGKSEEAGTVIEIYFPSKEEAVPTGEEKKKDPNIKEQLSNMNILLVEDDTEISELLETVLTKAGASVLTSNNGKEALVQIEKNKNKINFLITDIMIPEVSGNDVYREAIKIIPGLKALFTSGYSDAYSKLDSNLKRSTGFLQKPFTVKKLLEKINSINKIE
ncbi:MAG: PAS domain S-box protein [Spirochaetes bacterium]|nr:PAS domain S-box protein [Spirochaetota bacterium]